MSESKIYLKIKELIASLTQPQYRSAQTVMAVNTQRCAEQNARTRILGKFNHTHRPDMEYHMNAGGMDMYQRTGM